MLKNLKFFSFSLFLKVEETLCLPRNLLLLWTRVCLSRGKESISASLMILLLKKKKEELVSECLLNNVSCCSDL